MPQHLPIIMKNKKHKPNPLGIHILILFVLLSLITIVSNMSNINKITAKELIAASGQYYSPYLGFLISVPEQFRVLEKNNSIIMRNEDSSILIEKMQTTSQTADDAIMQYSEIHNLRGQVITSSLETYVSFYLNGEGGSTKKGFAKMIDTDTLVILTSDDPNNFTLLEEVAIKLKYVK